MSNDKEAPIIVFSADGKYLYCRQDGMIHKYSVSIPYDHTSEIKLIGSTKEGSE